MNNPFLKNKRTREEDECPNEREGRFNEAASLWASDHLDRAKTPHGSSLILQPF